MMKKSLVFAALAALAAAPAEAMYIGSVGFPMKNGGNALELVYDSGEREVEVDGSSTDVDVETNRLYAQYSRGLGNGLELFGRLMPSGSAEIENSNLDFDLFGFGGGVRWSPKQRGTVKFGLQASLDWSQGDDQDVDIDMTEFRLSGGVSHRVNTNVDVYGGLSFLKLDGTIESAAGNSDFDNSDVLGIFGGLDLKPSRNFTVGLELHLMSETLFAISGRFKF